MKKMVLRFEDWLNDQQQREDLVGDLARSPSMQTNDLQFSKRKSDEHKTWVEIVIKLSDPRYIAIFNEAWQEFLLAKKVAKDTND
jgi:hypothetical protein